MLQLLWSGGLSGLTAIVAGRFSHPMFFGKMAPAVAQLTHDHGMQRHLPVKIQPVRWRCQCPSEYGYVFIHTNT